MSEHLPISYEEMRTVVVSYLSRGGGGQLNYFQTGVYDEAHRLGLIPQVNQPPLRGGMRQIDFGYSGGRERLADSDNARVLSIFWDLLIEGVVRPGSADGLSTDLPFYHITEWGKSRLKDGPASPYDPDGYLKRPPRRCPASTR